MKVNELMKRVEGINELKALLKLDLAHVICYVDDEAIRLDDENHVWAYTLNDLALGIKREYVLDFWMAVSKADFKGPTYGNTLEAIIECRGITHKVEGKKIIQYL